MSFSIPRDQVLPVEVVDVRLADEPHPFEQDNAETIDENWRHETAANPALFDGPIALLSRLRYRDRRLEGRCHIVRYATFLLWRRTGRSTVAGHAYAHAALVASDGALVAIRMAPGTLNAGRVYFAAGSFEPEDFRDGQVDLASNMRREVLEETGLDIAGLAGDPNHHAFSHESGTVIFRRYYLAEPADVVARRIAAFVAADPAPEIAGPVILRDAENLSPDLMPQMPAIIRWHFGRGA